MVIQVQVPCIPRDVSDRWNDYVRTSESGYTFAYEVGYAYDGRVREGYERHEGHEWCVDERLGEKSPEEIETLTLTPITNDGYARFALSSEICIRTREHQGQFGKQGNQPLSRL